MLDLFAKHWGDIASVAGLVVSVIGFWYAIWLARQARTAAQQARKAAEEARDRIFLFDTISELTAARSNLSEIIRLQQLNVWEIAWATVLERYATARLGLVRCEQGLGVPEPQRKSFREAVALLSIMIVEIDAARISGDSGALDTSDSTRALRPRLTSLKGRELP
jgi:hypothetical protein